MTATLRILFSAIMIVLVARPVHAQSRDSTLVVRYQLADAYLSSGQFDRAISLLEDLVARSPATPVFQTRLQEAYESVKRYDEAIALLRTRLTGRESRTVLLSEIARIQYLKGDEEAAFETWDAAESAEPAQPGAFLAIYRSLFQVRLFDRAIRVLEKGRETLGNLDLFRSDLAYMYALDGRYAEAMTEYLAILEQSERQFAFVRTRIESMIEQPEALDAAIAAAERGVRSQPLNGSIRDLLGWLYVQDHRFNEALDAYRAIDRLQKMQGQVLYGFAQQAADAGAFDAALAAFREVVDRNPGTPSAANAQAGMGSLYERRAQARSASAPDSAAADWAAALDAYGVYLAGYPGHPLQPDVRYRIARIRLDALSDLDAAEADLEQLVSSYPGYPAADRAAFDLGRLDLIRDRLDAARVHFTRLADRLRTGELAEAARMEIALLHYYRGEFDAARAIAESMKDNTSADVSNDAIQLKVDLLDNRGPDSLDTSLRAYAYAQLLERQRKPAESLVAIDELLEQLADHPLLDDALFFRARMLATVGRTGEAVSAYLEFPLVQPDSPLGDRALFAAADLQANILGDHDAAIETYTRLLETYPGSLLASETRSLIRRLRGDGV